MSLRKLLFQSNPKKLANRDSRRILSKPFTHCVSPVISFKIAKPLHLEMNDRVLFPDSEVNRPSTIVGWLIFDSRCPVMSYQHYRKIELSNGVENIAGCLNQPLV